MIPRRTLLAGSAALATGGAVSSRPAAAKAGPAPGAAVGPDFAEGALSSPTFRHGVASGDPLPTSVVLWTRVTPTAGSQPGSGVGPRVTVGWVTTWDDHESANDAWTGGAENHRPDSEGDRATRRAVARTAYDEWMPVRLSGTAAAGDGVQVYRHLQFGRLADLSMLDLRSHRSQQVAATELGAVADPSRTITGDAQMRFLKDRLAEGDAVWKLVGNPVMVSPIVFPPLDQYVAGPIADLTGLLPPDGVPYNVDQWDGYTADRRELVDFLADRGIANAVFLTGDIHSAWACELPVDPGTYPLSRSVAVELVATSVTSNNLDDITGSAPRTSSLAVEEAIRTTNRHVRHLDFDSPATPCSP